MATIPNPPPKPGAPEIVEGVWLVSRAKRFVMRDGDHELDPVREMSPGRAQFFFKHLPGRFTFDPDIVELPQRPPPSGAELAELRRADAAQRDRKLAQRESESEAPRVRKPAGDQTPAQRLAARRQAEVGEDAPKDPAERS